MFCCCSFFPLFRCLRYDVHHVCKVRYTMTRQFRFSGNDSAVAFCAVSDPIGWRKLDRGANRRSRIDCTVRIVWDVVVQCNGVPCPPPGAWFTMRLPTVSPSKPFKVASLDSSSFSRPFVYKKNIPQVAIMSTNLVTVEAMVAYVDAMFW